MEQRICSIGSCEKTAAKRGWCPMHYQRWRQHGDLNRSRESLPKRPRALCTVQGCRQVHEAHGFCNMHYLRWKKHGDPHAVTDPPCGPAHHSWSHEISYSTAHSRVYKARGKADHCSVGNCATGNTTFQWANLTGQYADVMDYVQMCAVHHSQYDRARRNTEPAAGKWSRRGRRFSKPIPAPGGDLAAAVAQWWSLVEHWAVDERHVTDNKHAAQAAQALARAAGLLI